jgi:hypothetical protein
LKLGEYKVAHAVGCHDDPLMSRLCHQIVRVHLAAQDATVVLSGDLLKDAGQVDRCYDGSAPVGLQSKTGHCGTGDEVRYILPLVIYQEDFFATDVKAHA